MYEDMAREHLSNNLMRFHARELYVKATLVFLLLEVC